MHDFNAIKNTIKIHGLLLEHETQYELEKGYGVLGCSLTSSQIGYSLKHASREENRIIEIDVLIETGTFGVDPLEDLYAEKSGATFLEDMHASAKLRDFIIAQCKGNDQNGFLLARACSGSNRLSVPLLISPENNRAKERTQRIGTQDFAVVYRIPNADDYLPVFVDWAYFYSGEKNDLDPQKRLNLPDEFRYSYKQEKENNSNKFLKAVEQLNLSVDAFFITKPSYSSRHELHRLIPAIVTNSMLYVLEVERNHVQVKRNYPWLVYKNAYAVQSPLNTTGINHGFFIVNSAFLQQFVIYQRWLLAKKPGIPRIPIPEIIGQFNI